MARILFRVPRLIWALAAAAVLVSAAPTFAEGFRIATKVFVGEEKPKQKQPPEPITESTTLFLNGVVYDFLDKPEQTAIYRKPTNGKPGQFTLLSDEHSIQTKISTKMVTDAVAKFRGWAAQQKDPFLQFAANPKFDESFNRNTGKLVLASFVETYTVETEAGSHDDAMAEYRDYLDAYTQLDTLLSGGQLQPEPRLRLNAVLARHKVVPLKVELSRPGEEPVRAEHEFTWRLSQDDQKRIDNVRTALTQYHEVANEEFLRATRPKETTK